MTLKVELVLLEPADVELLTCRSSLELARNVLFVVANNPTCFVVSMTLPRRRSRGAVVTYFVMMPVVLTPSVRCVTKNLPAFLIGA